MYYLLVIDFELPKMLIATAPANPRDSAKLLVYNRATKQITDAVFKDIASFMAPNSTLVLNNSKVEHCRWLFGGGIELFILQKLDTHTVRAMVRKGKKFKQGMVAQLNNWLTAEVLAIDVDGIRTLKLNVAHDDPRIAQYEHIPLPPYIPQDDTLANDYQTVYAKPLGSKAAPTAGLHFTDGLLAGIAKQHTVAQITLHVGLGTFAALTPQQLKAGSLHSEWYQIDKPTAEKLNAAGHITAVGTTTVRTLESNKHSGSFSAKEGSTDILIQPGYKWQAIGSLITNFHLPGTSLLLLVESFVGSTTEMQRIYEHAIANNYRFYSFGDAMLIL